MRRRCHSKITRCKSTSFDIRHARSVEKIVVIIKILYQQYYSLQILSFSLTRFNIDSSLVWFCCRHFFSVCHWWPLANPERDAQSCEIEWKVSFQLSSCINNPPSLSFRLWFNEAFWLIVTCAVLYYWRILWVWILCLLKFKTLQRV